MRCHTSSVASASPPESSGRPLHRLRHAVATHLVGEGQLLKAQARLGHQDPTTTLRHYSHSVALHDEDIADNLDQLLNNRQ
jgi:integrase